MFKKSTLSSAMIAALSTIATLPAVAETETKEAAEIEVIEVIGIRGSMERALDIKRSSDSIVDAISAEDIGQFPDQNLAESLQRITGVSIDRQRGEGQFVSVRGLGPEFVQVTINGRSAPSSDGGTRAFRFDQLQSELVQTLEVSKSATADLSVGGLAGTVNVKTRRPLDIGKRVINIGLATSYSELSGEYDPRVSALYSDVNADGDFGYLFGGSFSSRNLREDKVNITGYAPFNFKDLGGESGTFARNIVTRLFQEERERLNLSGALQWQLEDDTNISFDALYSDYDVSTNNMGLPFRSQNKLSANASNVVVEDGLVTSLNSSTARPRLDAEANNSLTKTLIVGLNVAHQIGDLNINADLAWSSSETDEVNNRVFYQPKGSDGTDLTYALSDNIIPTIQLGSGDDLTDPSRFFLGRLSQAPKNINDEELQFKLNANYVLESSVISMISAGISYKDHERTQNGDDIRLRKAFPNDPITNINSSLLPVDNFLTGIDASGWPTQWLVPDAQQAFDYYLNEQGATIDPSLFTSEAAQALGKDFVVAEESIAVYVRAEFEFDAGDIPISGNFGLRYVQTDQISTGNVTPITNVVFQPTPQFIFGDNTPQSVALDYAELLPSFNIVLDVTDDFLVRFAAGKVLTRASYEDLSPGITSSNASTRTVSQGTPSLIPLIANQLDLSFEWYMSETSAFTAGLFWKDINSFINDVVTVEEFTDSNGTTIPDPDSGANVTINIQGPRNEDGAKLYGSELAYQMTFDDILPEPFNGLGFMVNWTHVETDAEFINPNTQESFDIPGLSSDTYNAVIFYETGPYSLRLAYNYRDDFLDQISGTGGNPVFTDAYKQWDVKFAYEINESASFSLDMINIKDENSTDYNQLSGRNLLFSSANTGPRITAGVNISF
jgi:TonB-dependent receptor